jgi:hypothetical protein
MIAHPNNHEGFIDVGSVFMADAQAAELMKPT